MSTWVCGRIVSRQWYGPLEYLNSWWKLFDDIPQCLKQILPHFLDSAACQTLLLFYRQHWWGQGSPDHVTIHHSIVWRGDLSGDHAHLKITMENIEVMKRKMKVQNESSFVLMRIGTSWLAYKIIYLKYLLLLLFSFDQMTYLTHSDSGDDVIVTSEQD